jgi:hypothetical protein
LTFFLSFGKIKMISIDCRSRVFRTPGGGFLVATRTISVPSLRYSVLCHRSAAPRNASPLHIVSALIKAMPLPRSAFLFYAPAMLL